jgi:type IV fimbrial biogenesis protein FimT
MFKKQKAFTLMELLVTLSVIGILMGLAVPSFQSQMLNNRSLVLGEDFANAINFARSEAVKRSSRISICASNDGQNCAGAWTDGFIVLVDMATTDNAIAPDLGPQPVILRAWPPQNQRAVIDVQSGGAINFFRFTSLGALARVTNSAVTIDARLQNCTGNSARWVSVNLSGMIRTERRACPQ